MAFRLTEAQIHAVAMAAESDPWCGGSSPVHLRTGRKLLDLGLVHAHSPGPDGGWPWRFSLETGGWDAALSHRVDVAPWSVLRALYTPTFQADVRRAVRMCEAQPTAPSRPLRLPDLPPGYRVAFDAVTDSTGRDFPAAARVYLGKLPSLDGTLTMMCRAHHDRIRGWIWEATDAIERTHRTSVTPAARGALARMGVQLHAPGGSGWERASDATPLIVSLVGVS